MTLPRVLLAVLVLTLVVTGAATAASLLRGPPAPRLAASDPGDRAAGPDPLAVLHAWDTRRAAAWAAGDPAALGELYVSGTPAGRRDLAMLRAWVRRDVRVVDLRTQVLSARVLERSESRLVLLVTDRVAGGTAVGGTLRTTLPRDRATTRRIVWRQVAGGWRVAAVRAVPSSG